MERTYQYSEFSEPINCQFTTAPKAGNVDFHLHNSYEIYLLLEGEISYFVEQSCYHMKPGDVIIFTSQEIHKATNLKDTPFTRMVLHINPLFIWQFCTGQTNLLGCFHQHRPGANNRISLSLEQQFLFQTYFHQMEAQSAQESYGTDLRAITALIQLLLMVNECFLNSHDQLPDVYSHRIQPVMAYIDQHLSEALSLESISTACSLDKYYLSHLFKKETESTIFQYILVKRIAQAKELLSLGSSVTEACQQSGFNDYANFIRSFKKVTGYSPGHFKKLNHHSF
ncbi:MAG: AraC family transcriptional regulator [Hungatella sp.]